MAKTTFKTGDRIAYAAKFLRDTGQYTGNASQRRGTYLGDYSHMPATHGCVRWDDMEEMISMGKGQYADPEYVAEIRKHGQCVGKVSIARVGSSRFALNDL